LLQYLACGQHNESLMDGYWFEERGIMLYLVVAHMKDGRHMCRLMVTVRQGTDTNHTPPAAMMHQQA
jgi:hypothetical protein